MIIAIDGPAASGKGTLAKRVADYFGYPCLDTGLLYRAVARDVAAAGGDLEDEGAAAAAAGNLVVASLDDPALRLPGVGDKASIVAKFPRVRSALLAFQREFAKRPPGAVLDGRDIGTVVCPEADAKLFITASLPVRARRRLKELQERGIEAIEDRVLQEMQARDIRDSRRSVAPLEPAADAFVIDTTELDPEAVLGKALAYVNAVAHGRFAAVSGR
jgi:cytidylate kinase